MKTFFTLLTSILFCHAVDAQVLFNESFDNSAFPPAGWKNMRTSPTVSTTTNLWQMSFMGHSPVITPHTGAGMAFFNAYRFGPGVKTELTTPAINVSSPGWDTVSFWMYRDGQQLSMPDLVEVFMNSSQGSAGGVLIGTVNRSYTLDPAMPAPGWYRHYFFIPPSFNTTTCYITFRGSSSGANNIYIDDVQVLGPSQTTCHSPYNLRLNKLTNTTAEVTWNAYYDGSVNYDWELRTSGAAGSGASGLVQSGSTLYQSAPLTGLNANTNYQFYLRNTCNVTGASLWSPYFFTTACSINNIPFSENFDGVTAPALPNCFRIQNVNQSTTWVNTDLGSTVPAPSAPNAMVYSSATEAPGDDWFFTPALNLTAGVNYRLKFVYQNSFVNFNHKLEVKLGMVPDFQAMTGSAIYLNEAANNSNAEQASVAFTVPNSGVYYLGFHNMTPTGALNSKFLVDNILVDIGPDPLCGFPENITAANVTTAGATIQWNAPSNGVPQTYNWELRTTGLPGSGSFGRVAFGTEAGTTNNINFNSLNMESDYTFYIMSNCTAPSYGVWSAATRFTTLTTACNPVYNLNISNITSESFKASWTVPTVSSEHIGFDWELRTGGSPGSGATGLVQSGSSTDPFVTVSGLAANSSYHFYVKSRCASGNISNWTSPLVATTAVINDDCANAITLAVGNGFGTSPIASRMDNAYPTPGLSIGCGILTANNVNPLNDVWFKLVVPSTGNALVETYTINTNFRDQMMIAYSGSCGNLVEIACDRNGAPDDYANYNSFQSRIALTGRTPGEVIYIRVLPDANPLTFNNFVTGEFGIVAWDTTASVLPEIAPAGNCITNPTININTTNKNLYRWNPIFDGSGRIIAEIRPSEAIGIVNTKLYGATGSIRSGDSVLFIDRDISFTSTVPAGFLSAVRLYLTETEMQQIQALIPSAGIEDLMLMHGVSDCGAATPSTGEFMSPVWGRYGNDYYVEMATNNFNHFYFSIHKLLSKVNVQGLTGAVNQEGVSLQWETGFEANMNKYIIERSTDSMNFLAIGETISLAVNGNSDSMQYYRFDDSTVRAGVNYYRIKSIGLDGKIKYSDVYSAAYQEIRDFRITSVATVVQLDWITEKEIDNREFIIERSADSVNFSELAIVPTSAANGFSESVISYMYTDYSPMHSMNYYRIRQVNNLENIHYSEILGVMGPDPEYIIHTLEVRDASSCSAQVSAIISANGAIADSITFEYGIDTYTHSFSPEINAVDNTIASIDAAIIGLTPSTGYRLRAKLYFQNSWHYSDETAMHTADLYSPQIVLYGDSSFCAGSTILLSSTAPVGNQWFLDGQEIEGAVYDQYETDQPGVYSLIATATGCVPLSSAPVQIRAVSAPTVPVIHSPDGLSICDGKLLELSITGDSSYSYQWMRNGVVIRGAEGLKYTAASAGDYHVELLTPGGCTAISEPVSITALVSPDAPIIQTSGALEFCEGDSVLLTASEPSQWFRNGSPIDQPVTSTIKVNTPGAYYAVITSGSCRSYASDTFNVRVKPLPVASLITSTSTIFCQGGKILLEASEATGNSYEWFFENNLITNAASPTYETGIGGNYKVKITNNGCANTSATKQIVIKPLPLKAVITASGNTLSSSKAGGNQWFLNGFLIPGATSQQYTVKEAGTYMVEVTENGCSSRSDEFNFVATGIVNPVTFNDINYFPNPVTDKLTIRNDQLRKLSLRLTDIYGKIILEQELQTQQATVDLSNIAPGTYLLIITDIKKKETLTRKLLKL